MSPSQRPKKGIERSIEWTGCTSFGQGRTWGSFEASRGSFNTFSPCARGAQSILI